MQSKKILGALSILVVLVLIFLGIRTTAVDTPITASDEPVVVEQSNRSEKTIESKPVAKSEFIPTQSTDKAVRAKAEALLTPDKTETPDQRWNPYIDQSSQEYEKLMEHADKEGSPFKVGETVYFRFENRDGIVFIDHDEVSLAQIKDPFTVYNRHLDDLNNLEEFGDWSADTQARVRNLFTQYYLEGSYDITALQCREKTCLVEFSFDEMMLGVKFVEAMRKNYAICQCIIAENMWPEERLAIIKIIFRD
ncbi:MAG: hypothetical protein MJK04_36670 [Psychrosphaera sp.]|nr:hypothetical protein [Psychrosphaera sp.]